MDEHRNKSSLLAHADQIAGRTSNWPEAKKNFARRATSSIVSPMPQSIDVGPHSLRPSDFINRMDIGLIKIKV
ncbi:hypothetical protein ABC766_30875 [Methylobacterium fujisawaense]|uniref:hypothetical protein n=1 Tax=Methylobacterium fujisawaense TaxID=107400 RepID=UPI0031F552C8